MEMLNESKKLTVIKPEGFWSALNFRELWGFRDLGYFLFIRNLKATYKQTALGPLWIILQPLLQMLIFTVIFSKVAKLDTGDVPYPLFNFVALVVWTYFMQCVTRAANSLRDSKDLLTKVYFPRIIMPVVGVFSSALDFIISCLLAIGFAIYLGFIPGWGLLWLPFLLLVTGFIAISVGIWVAPWVVHFWDVTQVLNYFLRAWMFACPVVYKLADVPQSWQKWYMLNPMAHVVEQFRNAVLGKPVVFEPIFWISLVPFVVLFIVGLFYFRKAERSIVDIA